MTNLIKTKLTTLSIIIGALASMLILSLLFAPAASANCGVMGGVTAEGAHPPTVEECQEEANIERNLKQGSLYVQCIEHWFWSNGLDPDDNAIYNKYISQAEEYCDDYMRHPDIINHLKDLWDFTFCECMYGAGNCGEKPRLNLPPYPPVPPPTEPGPSTTSMILSFA